MDSKKLALICRELADDKKAENIVVLDVKKISSITDYFDVIVHIMRTDVREHYDLESLWGDAPRVRPRRQAARVKVS